MLHDSSASGRLLGLHALHVSLAFAGIWPSYRVRNIKFDSIQAISIIPLLSRLARGHKPKVLAKVRSAKLSGWSGPPHAQVVLVMAIEDGGIVYLWLARLQVCTGVLILQVSVNEGRF